MPSSTTTSNGYTITIKQRSDIGSLWTVRTTRRVFGFRFKISSDWFLDQQQAEQFAGQLAVELERGSDLIKKRRPGWVLRRAAH
jgi:hypothetical protein